MAKILPFAAERVNRHPSHRDTSAEVVIFPGVRVEYHERTAQPKAKHRRPRRRQKSGRDALSA